MSTLKAESTPAAQSPNDDRFLFYKCLALAIVVFSGILIFAQVSLGSNPSDLIDKIKFLFFFLHLFGSQSPGYALCVILLALAVQVVLCWSLWAFGRLVYDVVRGDKF